MSSPYRAEVALVLAEEGKGALVLPHLNDVFANVEQRLFAVKLLKGQTAALAEHLHRFKKRSLDIYIADALAQAGYGDEVMNKSDTFSCPPDELKSIVTSGLGGYDEREEKALTFIRNTINTPSAEEVISVIKTLNPLERIDVALALAEEGKGSACFTSSE